MDSLANETLVHIFGFLDAKEALMFSMTSSLHRELVLANPKVVRDRISHENSEHKEEKWVTNIRGVSTVLRVRKEQRFSREKFGTGAFVDAILSKEEGCLLKGKKNGTWKTEKHEDDSVFSSETRSAWTDGKLDYVHVKDIYGEMFLLPRECKKGEMSVSFEGQVLACAFVKAPLLTKKCEGVEHGIFKCAKRRTYVHCCEKHQGEMPKSLF